jgi:hypothetical protein
MNRVPGQCERHDEECSEEKAGAKPNGNDSTALAQNQNKDKKK